MGPDGQTCVGKLNKPYLVDKWGSHRTKLKKSQTTCVEVLKMFKFKMVNDLGNLKLARWVWIRGPSVGLLPAWRAYFQSVSRWNLRRRLYHSTHFLLIKRVNWSWAPIASQLNFLKYLQCNILTVRAKHYWPMKSPVIKWSTKQHIGCKWPVFARILSYKPNKPRYISLFRLVEKPFVEYGSFVICWPSNVFTRSKVICL